jgi:hypothetical protein
MYIYADESGHTGRAIFHKPRFYLQGAILSIGDTEPLLQPICNHYKTELAVDRLHANELDQSLVEEIAATVLNALGKVEWVFHVTKIEKQYLGVTKFVDSIFDSGENKGARWLWYTHEFFRHTLCCFFDDLLPTEVKRGFWEAFLCDDYEGISCVLAFALEQLEAIYVDARLKEVAGDALSFALENPEEITLMAAQTKKSYKGHTPNMVAFMSLLQAVHRFCKDRGTTPKVFIHDPQCEFGQAMREYHSLHSSIRIAESETGMPEPPERVEYGLGEFALRSSKEVASLQMVDVLLWLTQRSDRVEDEMLRCALAEHTDPFYISRAMSDMIVFTGLLRSSKTELTEEQLLEAKKAVDGLEQAHLKRLSEFRNEKGMKE